MTRGTGALTGLAAAVLAGVLGVASPAAATAAHATASHTPPSYGARVQDAVAASNRTVLIVHTVAARHALRNAITAAEHTGAGLRHTFARPRSFSVQIPTSDAAA